MAVYVFISPIKGSYYTNDLLVPDPVFHLPLMVTAQDIAILFDIYHPMQYELPVPAAIKGDVVFFQFFRRPNQYDFILPVAQHRQHTLT